MPARLRPTAPIAANAILVGDPGRALMLAQVVLREPKMSNHARGLWGYTGLTEDGHELSLQATGMGGPSAAVVLADLVELGVRRAVRVGTCTALDPELEAGQLLAIYEAHAWGGGGAGAAVLPDPELSAALRRQLAEAVRPAAVASLDVLHGGGAPAPVSAGDVADMQTAALFSRAKDLEVGLAAILVVTETAAGEELDGEAGESAARLAGTAAATVLSTSS
jgi:purine-nucleoside phosphorylase